MASFLSRVPFRQRDGHLGESIWYASLILLLLPVYLGFYDTSRVPALKYGLLLGSAVAYGLLLFKLCFLDGHTWKQLLGMGAVLFALALGVLFSGIRSLVSVFLLVFSAKDVPFSKIVRVSLCFFFGALALNALLVYFGVLEDTLFIRGEAWGRGNVRHTLGFGYPNTLALWFMVSGYALLLTKRRGVFPWLPALALSLFAFWFTDSKAAFFSSVLAVLLYLLLPRLPLTDKKAGLFCGGCVGLMVVAYTLLSILYTPESKLLELANTLLSQRLLYSNQGLRQFGVSLLGARVNFGWDPVDSLYTFAPICMGLIPSLLLLGLHLYSTYRAASLGRWNIAAVSIAGALYSTMEYGLLNPIFLPVFAACSLLECTENFDKL